MRFHWSVLFCLLPLAVAGTSALASEAFFLGLDARDGLPQETVETVLRDSQGYVWIGTQSGLVRWDGHRMRVFRRDRNQEGLPGSAIKALAEGRDGRIWVGTLEAGVVAMQPDGGGMAYFSHDHGLAADRVSALVVAPDGVVWVGHTVSGLTRIDPDTGRVQALDLDVHVAGLAAAANGLWIAGKDGLGFLPRSDRSGSDSSGTGWPASDMAGDEDTQQPYSVQWVEADLGRVAAVDASPGWPVVAVAGDTLWMQDGQSGEFRPHPLTLPGGGQLQLYDVIREPEGTIWASSYQGLWRLSPDGEQVERITPGADRYQLPDATLRGLHVDEQGLLWIGTAERGLWRMVRPPPGVRVLLPKHQGQSLSIWQSETHDGVLWLGTEQQGLIGLDDSGEVIAAHFVDDATGVGPWIEAVRSGPDGMWIAAPDLELYRLRDNRLEFHPDATGGLDASRVYHIWDVLEDADGRVWISANGDGLHRWDPSTGERRAWRARDAEQHGLADDQLTVIHITPDGALWVGTEGSGLFVRRPGATRFQHLAESETGLPGGMVEAIRHDSQGTVWVGTYDGGLAGIDPDGGIRHLTEASGLPSDVIVGLEVDARDRIWAMTDLGLVLIDTDGSIRHFGQAQGFPPVLMNVGAQGVAPNGDLVFGGTGSLLFLSPDLLMTPSSGAPLRVTELRVMGETIQADGDPSSPFADWRQQGLQLRHDQNAFSLDYALGSFIEPIDHRYRYRLTGLESDWHYTDARRASATYTNLDPGDYRFELEVMTADGGWRAAAPLPVRVMSPPWLSVPARLAYGLLLVAVTGGGTLLWRRRRQREQALRRERDQRQWIEQLHELTSRLAEPADRSTLLEGFLQRLMKLLPIEAAAIRLRRSGRLPPLRVGVERPRVPPVSSDDARLESLTLSTRRRVLGELHVRPRKDRPFSKRDRAALAAASDQAAQAMDMFLLVLEAEAANQAKSAFLAKLSHEIRTPVSGMLGLAGLLLRESLEERSRDYARAIQSSGQGLMAILSDILDHARIESGRLEIHPAPFDVVAAVEDTAALHAVAANDRGIALMTHVSRDIPARIITDEVRFRQILGNLLSNAVKFTEAGSVTAELTRYDAGRLCLRVSDTGPGLSEQAHDRLFQPFSRAEASETIEGTGLGLVICRELARLMGGEIRLDSRPGEGARFEVVFEAECEGGDDTGERPSTACRNPLILVGPDNPIRKLLQRRLAECGLIVTAHPEIPEETVDDALVLILDEQGLHSSGTTDDRLGWPLRDARLAEWLDRLSGHQPLAAAMPATAAPSLPSDPGGHRLLLAEDNPINARVVSDVLACAGYRVDVVADGLEALKRLEDTRYDLVLMDRHMPRLDGLAAVRRMRESGHSELPVIGLTAAVSPEEHADCRAAGMDRVVVKDGDPGPMLKAIREALVTGGAGE